MILDRVHLAMIGFIKLAFNWLKIKKNKQKQKQKTWFLLITVLYFAIAISKKYRVYVYLGIYMYFITFNTWHFFEWQNTDARTNTNKNSPFTFAYSIISKTQNRQTYSFFAIATRETKIPYKLLTFQNIALTINLYWHYHSTLKQY
jgi:hypothetical protein